MPLFRESINQYESFLLDRPHTTQKFFQVRSSPGRTGDPLNYNPCLSGERIRTPAELTNRNLATGDKIGPPIVWASHRQLTLAARGPRTYKALQFLTCLQMPGYGEEL